jgi:hypothetical protein
MSIHTLRMTLSALEGSIPQVWNIRLISFEEKELFPTILSYFHCVHQGQMMNVYSTYLALRLGLSTVYILGAAIPPTGWLEDRCPQQL